MYDEPKVTNPRNPDPWLALELDQSLPMDKEAKAALLRGQRGWSRRLLLPLVRPIAKLGIIFVQLLRLVMPERWQSPNLLHKTIYLGLKYFVSPDANRLILRHFNIGTEILAFTADNMGSVDIETTQPLRPKSLEDLLGNTFLIHDLNVFNFIIELNSRVSFEKISPKSLEEIDFSSISTEPFEFSELPDKWHNFLDLQTAIEIYTPLYALLLSDRDFWRASNSLQLDETVAIYIARIFGDSLHLSLVHNGHPTVPFSTLEAGFRLMLHGLDAECLHGYLRDRKIEQTIHNCRENTCD
ncbi:hypothetical protein GQF03_05595 [Sneathiella chungangensis]|uniref:Uncharacterized protein n=1 Tax=Sneathiella chungangensis TaxID=1418234 RepID=A0A845MCT6_9PROT|nr:hypothetical protein [Sneathiella chungangensis]MZR21798.1 hypothetical protein [Sneathiella chungangensis]